MSDYHSEQDTAQPGSSDVGKGGLYCPALSPSSGSFEHVDDPATLGDSYGGDNGGTDTVRNTKFGTILNALFSLQYFGIMGVGFTTPSCGFSVNNMDIYSHFSYFRALQ